LSELRKLSFLSKETTLVQEQRQEFSGLIHDIFISLQVTAEEQFEFSQELEVNPSHGFLLQHYAATRNNVFRCIDEGGEFVQSEMDILQMSQADNDKH
jgi:hypothetical protein